MILFSRPQMHQLFVSKIPKEKLHLGKKIESIEDNGEEVTIHCADGSSASGDILVGADGAYSSVRTSLFKAMAEKGLLPEADKEDLTVGHICMVGTTKPLEDNTYKALKDDFSHFERVIMQGTPHSVKLSCAPIYLCLREPNVVQALLTQSFLSVCVFMCSFANSGPRQLCPAIEYAG